MNIDELRAYCLAKIGTDEATPFGETVLVFRVGGKMFALTGVDNVPPTVNLKCDPERAVELRERHEAIRPGYHMNKQHWNTVTLDGSISRSELCALIDHSYDLVRDSLPKKIRAALQ